jgi:hypothetical protein
MTKQLRRFSAQSQVLLVVVVTALFERGALRACERYYAQDGGTCGDELPQGFKWIG